MNFTAAMQPMVEAMRAVGMAASRAAASMRELNTAFQDGLEEMLNEQIEYGRRQRRVHLLTLLFAVVWAYCLFGFMPMGHQPMWLIAVVAVASGWLILDALYWATRWDNYVNDAEATRLALWAGVDA